MLINCAAYQNGRKLADLAQEEIHDYLQHLDCFVWVALRDPSPEDLDAMARQFDLHELAVEDARNGHQRPKLEEYDDVLFCVVRTLEHDEQGALIVGELDLFVGPNFVLSIRNGTRKGFQSVRERCEHEPELLQHGAGFVFYALIDAAVDRYFAIMHRLEDELDELEERLFGSKSSARQNIEDLYALKRKLVTVSHAVVPLHEAVGRLHGGRVPRVCFELQNYYRDVDDHLARIIRSLETQRDMLSTAIQVNLAMISLDDSSVSKQLAAWAALFAIPTMIAGLYGMNFNNMPGLSARDGFQVTLLVMLLLDVLMWWRFRKAGWL
ncbi:magnesium/cobalt transporter CorA [Vogesella oryzae]|uniref:magnesium/cobalt transporter CorA n=1 Tax=Vogesella oryzae TaxID=1735285 RepID=UPI001583B417|nr:magnesium/cobalt transporter CorA [Vogesella oryzae]